MHVSAVILTKVILLVGLQSLVAAEPIPGDVTTTSQGNSHPNKGSGGSLIGLGNVHGGGNGGSGGLLNLDSLLGGSGKTGGSTGGNNGGLGAGIGNGGLLGGGGLLGTGIQLGSGENGLLSNGGLLGTGVKGDVGLGLGVSLGKPQSYSGKNNHVVTVKGKRHEGEDLDEVLVRRQSGDAANALKLHNDARAAKSIPTLAWDPALAAAAQSWADNLARIGRLEHSGGSVRPGQGENLAFFRSSGTINDPMARGTRAWLAEEKNYNGQIIPQGNFASYGHYTQCMWKSSTRVGIATASDGKGAWYTVARYTPQGNINGQKPY